MGRQARAPDIIDPRVERSRRVIRQAALAELAETGYGGFTIESVAARARAGKSTIYRHWGTKLALIADALETFNEQPPHHPSDGTPRERVEELLRHFAEVFRDTTLSACIPALIEAAEHNTTVRDFYHQFSARHRQALTDAVADGVASGDFPPRLDPEWVSLALSGAVLYRRLLTQQPFDPAQAGALIDNLLGSHPTPGPDMATH